MPTNNVIVHELQTEDGGTGRHVVIVDGEFVGWLVRDVDQKYWHCHSASGMHLGAWSERLSKSAEAIRQHYLIETVR